MSGARVLLAVDPLRLTLVVVVVLWGRQQPA
jgi:hypothetical protein